MKIIAGSTHYNLASKLASLLNADLIIPDIDRFNDSEYKIRITENIYGDHVYIIQSTCKPVNDNLVELLLLVDTAYRAGAAKITTIIPYFGYSRQDHVIDDYGPSAAQLMTNIIKYAGAGEILIIDIHTPSIIQHESIYNIDAVNLLTKVMPDIFNNSSSIIIGPDKGSTSRVQQLSLETRCDFAILDKVRTSDSSCIVSGNVDVQDKHCILVDDIASTGITLYQAVNYLSSNKAASIDIFVTHLISQNSLDSIMKNSVIRNIYVTDTIVHHHLPNKIHILSIDLLLVDIIKKLNKDF
ncbi:MAG: ribose-phosphate pyrophosphokinase [Rickettsiaceae bacterium]|nr:MAG: ribose-phosphate pyrophosphokinase [Rickettsiaceae bacterium]